MKGYKNENMQEIEGNWGSGACPQKIPEVTPSRMPENALLQNRI